MKKVDFRTETYDIGGGFYVDIVTKNDAYESWIYHKDYGQKELMFGCPKEQQSYSEFVDIAQKNISWHRDTYLSSIDNEEDAMWLSQTVAEWFADHEQANEDFARFAEIDDRWVVSKFA